MVFSNDQQLKSLLKAELFRHHFIRHSVQNNLVQVEHLSTEDMLADILTKPLHQDKHLHCVKGLGMIF